MAYSALSSKSSSDTLDLDDYNKIKGNFEAGVPDIFAAKGDLAGGTAADTAGRLAVGSDSSILVADSAETTGLKWHTMPGARVYNSANIDPATSSWVTLTFDSERTDPDAMHSTASNTSRLTVPSAGHGFYLIGGTVAFDTSGASSGGSIKGVRVYHSHWDGDEWVQNVIAEHTIGTVHAEFVTVLSICTLYQLTSADPADYVELQVYTNTDVDVVADGNYSPEFWAIWQREL